MWAYAYVFRKQPGCALIGACALFRPNLFFSDWSKCDEFQVPYQTGDFRVKVRIEIDDDIIFEEEQDIKIKKPELITLVQTDKPIYKPGQTGMD